MIPVSGTPKEGKTITLVASEWLTPEQRAAFVGILHISRPSWLFVTSSTFRFLRPLLDSSGVQYEQVNATLDPLTEGLSTALLAFLPPNPEMEIDLDVWDRLRRRVSSPLTTILVQPNGEVRIDHPKKGDTK